VAGDLAVTTIIAEAGTNHASSTEGKRLYNAMELASAAMHAGADYVKYQLFTGDPIFCPVDGDEARKERWKQAYLSPANWVELARFCKDIGIGFMASAFDRRGVIFLANEVKPDYYKVASRAVDTYPYADAPGPFLISNAFNKPLPKLCCGKTYHLLQCSPQYPTPLKDARWRGGRTATTRANDFEGMSDHSGSVWPGIDAILRCTEFLEVHFATDLANAGRDQSVCLTPNELRLLCEARDAAAVMYPH
jgi:N,N'-diacetyllegionaminate synthase